MPVPDFSAASVGEPSLLENIIGKHENKRSTKTRYSSEQAAFWLALHSTHTMRLERALQLAHEDQDGETLTLGDVRLRHHIVPVLYQFHQGVSEHLGSVGGFLLETTRDMVRPPPIGIQGASTSLEAPKSTPTPGVTVEKEAAAGGW